VKMISIPARGLASAIWAVVRSGGRNALLTPTARVTGIAAKAQSKKFRQID
jgi:hypothetical protein